MTKKEREVKDIDKTHFTFTNGLLGSFRKAKFTLLTFLLKFINRISSKVFSAFPPSRLCRNVIPRRLPRILGSVMIKHLKISRFARNDRLGREKDYDAAAFAEMTRNANYP